MSTNGNVDKSTLKEVTKSSVGPDTAEQAPTLTQLAENILKKSRELEGLVKKSLNYQTDVFREVPAGTDQGKVDSLRSSLVSDIQEANQLIRGPVGDHGRIHNTLFIGFALQAALAAVHQFKIADHVPQDGTISYTDLATKAQLDEIQLRRVLRLAMTNHMFYEPSEGQVAHTVDSRLLASDSSFRDFFGLVLTEHRPASYRLGDAMKTFAGSQEPTHSAWNLANETEEPFYKHISGDPERIKQFSNGMASLKHFKSLSPELFVATLFPWEQNLGPSATVVDVGGGRGQISTELAKKFPSMHFTVQDLPQVVGNAADSLPADLKERVTFSPYNFFEEQPVKEADAYLIARCFHNWPDAYCKRIVQGLIPAMKKGTRVLVLERLTPEDGNLTAREELESRTMDVYMMALVNGGEKSAEHLSRLFQEVDGRFHFKKLWRAEGCLLKIVEIAFDD